MEILTSRHNISYDEAVFQKQRAPIWTALEVWNTDLFNRYKQKLYSSENFEPPPQYKTYSKSIQ